MPGFSAYTALFLAAFVAVVADCCVRARSSAAAAAGVLGGVLFDFFIAVRIARRCATTSANPMIFSLHCTWHPSEHEKFLYC